MSLISVENISLGYDNDVIVKDLCFEVNDGDYLCIVGENGAGKSTLMNTMLGLRAPLSGNISFNEGLTRNEIGYLPQQTIVQRDFPASVYEIVLSGFQGRLGKKFFYSREMKETAKANMQRMHIEEFGERCYKELSGGQQQRVLLARALCATERVLLLDEPVAGLDPKVTAELYALIKELNETGITIIMVSHDIGAAVRYASHILHVGRKTFFGTVEDYKQSKLGKKFLAEYEDSEDSSDDESLKPLKAAAGSPDCKSGAKDGEA